MAFSPRIPTCDTSLQVGWGMQANADVNTPFIFARYLLFSCSHKVYVCTLYDVLSCDILHIIDNRIGNDALTEVIGKDRSCIAGFVSSP